MFKKKKVDIDENKFYLDKDSMMAGKPDAKPPTKISTIIKMKLIFLLVFVAITCAITIYLVYITNKHYESKINNIPEISEIQENKTYKATNKNEWFYLNQLGYEKKYAKGDNYQLEYFEIDGLNDSKCQNTINNLIIKKENSIFDEVRKKYSTASRYDIKADVIGNFANILSIKLTINIKVNSEQYVHGYRYITINLIDGNDVKISDVINSSDVKIILYQYGYKNLAEKYSKVLDIPQTGKVFDLENAKELEEEAYQFVNEVVNHSSKATIGITSSKILITYPQNMNDEIYTRIIEIPLSEINGKETVYNRYLGNNLYDLSYEKIGPFPVYMDSSKAYSVIYEKNDNCFIDVVIENNNEIDKKEYDESFARIINYMDKMANQTKTKASDDKTRFYYLTAYVVITPEGSNINANINGVNNNYLTKELFEKEVYTAFVKKVQGNDNIVTSFKYTPDVGNPTIINKNVVINKAGEIVEEKDK